MLTLTPTLAETEIADSPSLIARAQQRDSESFCQLCRIHGNRLVRQATALCGDLSLAEDLAQETLIEAWKSIRRYNGQCRFFTWLCAILLNRYRNVLRRKRPLAMAALNATDREGAESLLEKLPDQAFGPDEASAQAERTARLRACIKRLAPKHQQVIHLRFYVDDSLEGIAAALDCSVGTVKSRLFYAIEQLRAMAQRERAEI